MNRIAINKNNVIRCQVGPLSQYSIQLFIPISDIYTDRHVLI